MRQAKTAFPSFGSPITHVDVTWDGKWILGTTDTYLILICTLFTDKDGKTKTGFTGQMGNKIPAPRLLKLTPVVEYGLRQITSSMVDISLGLLKMENKNATWLQQ